jgi:hypothetical protein
MLPRPALAALVAGVALAIAACRDPAAGAGTSCAGPQPTLSSRSVVPGQQVILSVDWLHSGCRDMGGSAGARQSEAPLVDVPVEVVQGATHTVVGTVSGRGERFTGTLTFTLPGTLQPGDASVVLGGGAAGTSVPIVVVPTG